MSNKDNPSNPSPPEQHGEVFPFVFITIMCGAISGFHSLIASGTTPKMVERERDILPISYGAMVLEGFVGVIALVAACSLHPASNSANNAKTSEGNRIGIDCERIARSNRKSVSKLPRHDCGCRCHRPCLPKRRRS